MPRLIRLTSSPSPSVSPFLAAFVAALVWQDVMGIGHLILGSPSGWIAAAMLVVFNGIIFAAVQFGLRVMMLAEDDDTPRGGLRQHDIPVPVKANAPATPRRPRR